MHNLTFRLPPGPDLGICQALIDQNVYIGEDPVGHVCMRPATAKLWIKGCEIPICDRCYLYMEEQATHHPGYTHWPPKESDHGQTPTPGPGSPGPLAGPQRPNKTPQDPTLLG